MREYLCEYITKKNWLLVLVTYTAAWSAVDIFVSKYVILFVVWRTRLKEAN